jgi:molybdate transport system substrate-binding protein
MARYNRLIMFLLATLLWINPAMALADTVLLYAAGGLRDALIDVAKAYQAKTGNKIEAKYGPSGILKDEIANGAAADAITVAAGRVE